MARTVLLIGPGWLGAPTAAALAATGHRVHVLQRTPAAPPDGCSVIAGAVEQVAEDPAQLGALATPIDALVLAVAPSRHRGEDHAIYPATARATVRLAAQLGVRRLLQVSSTGVYNRHDGAFVREDTPLLPGDHRVQALQEAEQIIRGASDGTRDVCIVRPAGLYGPGRDPAGRFQSTTHPTPHQWCNFSWRDDVIGAIAHLLHRPRTAPVTIFNCTDNAPVQAGAIVEALTGHLPPPPPSTPSSTWRSHQRVSSDALIATGWRPRVPDIYAGLQRLGHGLPGRA